MELPRDRLGSTALQWCGYAYVYAFAWLVVLSLRDAILKLPEIGDSIFKILGWLALILAPAAAVAATVLGLVAAVHALVTRGSARQAAFGLLAALLCVAGAAGVWWLGAIEEWLTAAQALTGS